MTRVKLLIVDDDDLFLKSISKELDRIGFQVGTAMTAEAALARIRSEPPDVVLLDIRLPDQDGTELLGAIKQHDPSIEVIMLTAHGTVDSAVLCLRAGAYHYLLKPAKLAEIEALVQKAFERKTLKLENQALRNTLSHSGPEIIVGASSRMRELLSLVERVASSDQTVLILGESGTGKELIARRIHRLSPRRHRPFVLLDCASLSKSLLETELFGHEKGAFTGAVNKKLGLIEAADTGTLFVDEVGALEPEMQADFLRLMETRQYRRVGGTNILQADVRIIAATNADLRQEAREGRFREDLFFRLSVLVLELPPLRERPEDIGPLAEHLLAQAGFRGVGKTLSKDAVQRLREHDWPGNVRELRNVIERAAVLSDGRVIERHDLGMYPSTADRALREVVPKDELPSLRELQFRYIRHVLGRVGGNQQEAAKILEVDPKTLYRNLKKS